jgi:hypothetical protein
MQSVTTERNVRFTADFMTVYTSPGPMHNQLLTSPVQSMPPQHTQPLVPQTVQTPPASLPQHLQLPPAMSSGEEEVEVEGKLNKDELPSV